MNWLLTGGIIIGAIIVLFAAAWAASTWFFGNIGKGGK
jgi:hypothetical protein